MQIKTTLRFHITPVKWYQEKKQLLERIWEEEEPFFIAGRKAT